MERLLEFTANHWVLVSAFVAIIILLLTSSLKDAFAGGQSVTPIEATQLINHENAVIVDVREDKEFVEGHIVNAIHIPLGALNDRLNELTRHKTKHVIVNCRSGHRSAMACKTLRKEGFENVSNLKGGVLAWQSANLPLTKK
jgi:rhodanese-related sulfurtransferase